MIEINIGIKVIKRYFTKEGVRRGVAVDAEQAAQEEELYNEEK